MSAMASRMAGKAMSPSMTRITTMSRRRENPAIRPTMMPPTEVSNMVVTPTSSEMRLPWRTRLQTSRPNSSVPRKCWALGACRRAAGSSRVGLCVESTPASDAARTKARRISAPATTLRLASVRRSQRGRVDGAPAAARGSRTSTATSLIADPRIDDRVEEIDPKVDEHVGGGGDEDNPLHHRVIAPQNRRDDETAQPWDVEDDLRDDGATDQDGRRDADDRHDGHERVAESVNPRDRSIREPLGPRGADVVLLEHLEHARARYAGDQRRLVEAERKRGQDHVLDRAQRVREHGDVARRGQPAQAHGEEVDEVEAQPEAGNADAEQRDQHEPAVPGGASVGRRDRAGRHADG